jgi:hypothetical protein
MRHDWPRAWADSSWSGTLRMRTGKCRAHLCTFKHVEKSKLGNNCLPLFSLEQLEQLAEEKMKQLLETISQQKLQIAASRKEEEQLRQLLDSMQQGSSSLEEEKHLRQHRDFWHRYL